jgi:hypothetical protein
MNVVKTILIILLTTATLAAATERGVLWAGGWSTGYEVDAETGELYYSFEKPEEADKGMAYNGSYFWAGGNNTTIYKFGKTGTVVDDLAWDGEYLWVAYGAAFEIGFYKYDVNAGSIVDEIGGLAGGMPETPNIAVDDDGYIYVEYSDRTSDGGGYYYIFEPNGDDIYYFYDQGFLTYGMDVGEWPATSITPTSLGTIKALYK